MNEQLSQAAAIQAFMERNPSTVEDAQGPTVVFRAVPGAYLDRFKIGSRLFCRQTDKSLADELVRDGHEVNTLPTEPCRLAIVLATKHREEVLYHLALASEALAEGGRLILSAANSLGAGSLERRCAELMGRVESFSKHKCRVMQAVKRTPDLNTGLLRSWKAGGEMRLDPDTGLYTRPGIFSWKQPDAGSSWLADPLPGDLAGRGGDLGAGHGFLSRAALAKSSGITELHLFETERKALEAARLNLAEWAGRCSLHFHWADVAAGLGIGGLDFVLMNPPFHAGRGAVPALGQAFVREAMQALRPGGRLFMVANRHLPYEGVIQSHSGEIAISEQAQGFKRFVARRR
jgi:16S rRNA (guanine1207-N2)-methyltransferase